MECFSLANDGDLRLIEEEGPTKQKFKIQNPNQNPERIGRYEIQSILKGNKSYDSQKL